ncbi:TlpA family protein disulfide reductase [Oceanisphaera sp. KMM 10153]|uniref:TlpA family protein disulfide reductase n=1 Tax=Oceanisphaera submarina TaxID=3390193 RepID=UPI0039758D81
MGKQQSLFLAVSFLATSLAGCGDAATLTLSDGERRELSDYRGQWLVVNYFAEWCAPCLREMPLLNELNDIEGPEVLAVSFDSLPPAELKRLKTDYRMTMPVAAGLEGPWPFETPRALPTTMVINPSGKLVDSHQGELKAEDLARWQDIYWGD